MAPSEKFDIVVFGATGFTGKCVVQELMRKFANTRAFSWAVAGRNEQNVREVLDWAASSMKLGQSASAGDVIVADCDDENSIDNMTSRARVVINCCGPYILYGEPVVKACIRNRTHHVDITAEPEYMEKMYLEYQQAAEKAGVYIISACAFESVPFDLGIIHAMKNFPGVVNSVELYLEFTRLPKPAATSGTWDSLVHAFPTALNFVRLNEKCLSTLNGLKMEPRLETSFIRKTPLFGNQPCARFLEAMKTVSLRSQQDLYTIYKQRPVQLQFYLVLQSLPSMLWVLIRLMLVGFFIITLCGFAYGRKLLLRHPEFFTFGLVSRDGPTAESRAGSFATFRFLVEGWSKGVADKYERAEQINEPTNTRMATEISFSDIGYGFTAKTAVLSAFTILEESDRMPRKGGVLTPGVAFMKTNYLENLAKEGVTLKVLLDGQAYR